MVLKIKELKMSSSVLDVARIYKNKLQGEAHSLFRDMLMCKVSGVTFDNRQEAMRKVTLDTPVRLSRDRHNEHDFYAVLVDAFVDEVWEDVGFIPSSMNKKIAHALDAGVKLEAKVWKLSGGEGDFFRGLTITLERE